MDIFRLAITKKLFKDESGVVSKLQSKTITENGEHRPDTGYNGFSKVTVNVPVPEPPASYDGKVTITKKVTLDPEFNHYGVIPEGCWLDIQDVNGEYHNYVAGDPFPASYDDAVYGEYSDNGVKYWYAGTPDYEFYDLPVGVGWEMNVLEQEYSSSEIKVLESIGSMPVHAITGVWDSFFSGNDRFTSITIPKSVTYISLFVDAGGMPIGLPSLTSITYLGTKADWNNITFADGWNYDCPEITVTCTDGTITIPAYGS